MTTNEKGKEVGPKNLTMWQYFGFTGEKEIVAFVGIKPTWNVDGDTGIDKKKKPLMISPVRRHKSLEPLVLDWIICRAERNQPYTEEEIKNCLRHLERILLDLDVKWVIATGNKPKEWFDKYWNEKKKKRLFKLEKCTHPSATAVSGDRLKQEVENILEKWGLLEDSNVK